MSNLGNLYRPIIISALCLFSLQGCGDTTLLRYSQDLADKAKGSSTKVESFYGELRSAHSKMHTDELKLQQDASTPLDSAAPDALCPFTAEDVAVRVAAAKFIETYSVKLNDVGRSNDSHEMQSAISDVNSQLAGFKINGSKPLGAWQYANAPITTSMKLVGRRGLSLLGSKWFRESLIESDGVYVTQSKQLKLELAADAQEAVTRATKVQGLAERVYRKKMAARAAKDETDSALADVERISDLRQGLEQSNPASIYGELLELHARLMGYVKSKLKK